jgi:glycosyltransferase involved in cell wall biosynthesis
MRKTKETFPHLQITVIRWPINKEAPFQFDFGDIEVLEKSDLPGVKLKEWVENFVPNAIFCSGWIDKEYTTICKYYKNKIPVTLALDNHWVGSLKQRIAAMLSPFMVKSIFNHAWVPGEKQALFAKKLGFQTNRIEKGFYTADVDLFNKYGDIAMPLKRTQYPKRFLYVGRYVTHKGIFDMWKAFIEVITEDKNDEWELWSIGTGDQYEQRIEHPQIKHLGFIQPNDFQEIINQTSTYILPSHFEPWGVSLHEFAAAGFPVLVSKEIGSSEAFCEHGKNGYMFDAGNISQLKNTLRKMMKLNQNEFLTMQNHSIDLSLKNTPELWSKTLMKIANGQN